MDDDHSILECVRDILSENYEVAVARDGAEALDVASASTFDCIILDLMMPVVDGHEFMRQFRGREDWTPVILTSAATNVKAIAQDLGASDYLPKPFKLEVLESKLAAVTARAS